MSVTEMKQTTESYYGVKIVDDKNRASVSPNVKPGSYLPVTAEKKSYVNLGKYRSNIEVTK